MSLAGEEEVVRPLDVLAGVGRMSSVLAGEEEVASLTARRLPRAGCRMSSVLVGKEEVGWRAEEDGRPLDVLAGEEEKGHPPEILVGGDEVGRGAEERGPAAG